MAEYNQESGYIRQGEKPTSTYNAHQDEFGFKEGNEDPATAYGDSYTGAGGQTQFGLAGKTGRRGPQGSDHSDLLFKGAPDPMDSNFDKAPHGVESVPAGDGWGAEDTTRTHGAQKDGLVNKIKQKLPGQHHLADGTVTNSDPNTPPKKGIVEKVKEKLPGHHGSSDTTM